MEGILITKLKCLWWDCGHEWTPRTDNLPKVCPKCKRYDWNVPHDYKLKKAGARKAGGVNVAKSKRKRKPKSAIERFKERTRATTNINES